jgi:hypothetical protein
VYDSLHRKENVTKDLESRLQGKYNEMKAEKEEMERDLLKNKHDI